MVPSFAPAKKLYIMITTGAFSNVRRPTGGLVAKELAKLDKTDVMREETKGVLFSTHEKATVTYVGTYICQIKNR